MGTGGGPLPDTGRPLLLAVASVGGYNGLGQNVTSSLLGPKVRKHQRKRSDRCRLRYVPSRKALSVAADGALLFQNQWIKLGELPGPDLAGLIWYITHLQPTRVRLPLQPRGVEFPLDTVVVIGTYRRVARDRHAAVEAPRKASRSLRYT